MARPDANEPFSRQRFDRLSNHAAADAEADFEIVFGWQHRAGRDDLLSDLAAKASSAPHECGPASYAFPQIWRAWYARLCSLPAGSWAGWYAQEYTDPVRAQSSDVKHPMIRSRPKCSNHFGFEELQSRRHYLGSDDV